MSLKICTMILCLVFAQMPSTHSTSKLGSIKVSVQHDAAQRIISTGPTRQNAGLRRINPIRAILTRTRVSPLYLINGTVCRFINFQPVCTTLSTSGLSVGGSSGGSSSGGGSGSGGGGGGGSGGSGAARPGGSGGSGGGSSGGSGAGGGGSARPSSSGVLSGGSSVQFANQPARVSAMMQDEQSETFIQRIDGPNDGSQAVSSQQLAGHQATDRPAVGVLVARRPLRLLPFRRPTQYQIIAQRRDEIKNELNRLNITKS